jgi:hypothetical protein
MKNRITVMLAIRLIGGNCDGVMLRRKNFLEVGLSSGIVYDLIGNGRLQKN